jgi:uncharacterized protein (DUF885 family)
MFVLASVFAGALAVAGVAEAQRPGRALEAQTPAEEASRALEGLAVRELERSPEWIARLGLPVQGMALRRAQELDARSPAAASRARLDWIEALRVLDALSPAAADRDSVRIARFAYENLLRLSAFGYGQLGLGEVHPYAADHMRGAYLGLVDGFSDTRPYRSSGEVEIGLRRLDAVDDALDAEARRLAFDARLGVIPPESVLRQMRVQASTLAQAAPDDSVFLRAVTARISGSPALTPADKALHLARARKAVVEAILPAYGRYVEGIDALLALREGVTAAGPGVWALPDGEAYYDAVLAYYTTRDVGADEVYQRGLDVVRAVEAELDVELRAAGLDKGSVGERLALLSARPDQLYPQTPEGRQAILERLRGVLARAQSALGANLPQGQKREVVIEAVPTWLEPGAPLAYYQAGTIDGSRPGTLYINLRDTREWPDYTLPTLVFHEAVPGHHSDAALRRPGPDGALLNWLVFVPAQIEGWATYAEDLADEAGMFEGDPLGRIGYLQSVLLRAARCVVDTGIHARRWDRQTAVDYLVATTGLPRSAMESEVDRYIVWPGQAVTYLIGREEIRAARARAQRVLGTRFDLAEFHGAVLGGGPRPLAMIVADVDAWQAGKLAPANPVASAPARR